MTTHQTDPTSPLRFEVAIPLVTNPWIWVDMGKALGVAYGLLLVLMFWILRDEPWEEVWPAWRVVTLCVIAVLVLLLAVSVIVFRNRIVARFTLESRGVRYESGSLAGRVGTVVGLLSLNPLVMGSGLLAEAQSSLFLPWKDIRKVTEFPRWNVITLSNGWRPVLRLYCVDAPTFERARAVVESRIGQAR
jgi:hypothetical protein